jgi:hypothetical protein
VGQVTGEIPGLAAFQDGEQALRDQERLVGVPVQEQAPLGARRQLYLRQVPEARPEAVPWLGRRQEADADALFLLEPGDRLGDRDDGDPVGDRLRPGDFQGRQGLDGIPLDLRHLPHQHNVGQGHALRQGRLRLGDDRAGAAGEGQPGQRHGVNEPGGVHGALRGRLAGK